MRKLEGKIAVVTGGSRGIGAEIVRGLGTEGSTVVINYNHSKDEAEKVVEQVKAMGADAVALQADISQAEPTKEFIKSALEKYGRIDILVNNAGITRDKSFKKMTFEEWHKVIDTNLSSAFNTCKIALPPMLEQQYGRIINISSVIGQKGGFGQTNYASAKAGLIGFTKALALETVLAGITVNAICPGFIATEMVKKIPKNVLDSIVATIPMRKLGQPGDVAKGVIYICECEYMTGQCLNLNGGLYM